MQDKSSPSEEVALFSNTAQVPSTPGDQPRAASPRAKVLAAIADSVRNFNLKLPARTYIEETLKCPQRRARGHVVGRFASGRLGISLGIDEGPLGVAALTELETDQEWIAFLDFPPALKHKFRVDGRNRSFLEHPSFLAFRHDKVVLITLRREAWLRESASSSNAHIVLSKDGQTWTCPPATAAAAELGFEHEIWTESTFNRTRVKNLELLYDFYGEGVPTGLTAERQTGLVAAVTEQPMTTIGELQNAASAFADISDIFRAIAQQRLFVDLEYEDLTRYEEVRIFENRATLMAYRASEQAIARAADWVPASQRPLQLNDTLMWDGVVYTVVNVGSAGCALEHGSTIVTLEHRKIQKLIELKHMVLTEGSVALADARRSDALSVLVNTDPNDLETATLRLNRIEPYLAGLKHSPSSRSLRRYIAAFKDFEARCGNGLIGLIPRRGQRGNRVRRLQLSVLELVSRVINEKYLNATNISALKLYGWIQIECEDRGLPSPSYSWLCRLLKSMNQYEVTRARQGAKAAYQMAPRGPNSVDSVHIEPVRAWQLAYCDHTEADLETLFSESCDNAGRPWLSVMIDHFSRRALAIVLSYEPPSYRSVMLLIRECIRRFNRLPEKIVVDRGKEFRSNWLRALCAFLRVTLIDRPASEPRYGSVMERLFGTANTDFFHNLVGNTQLTKDPRQLTKEVNPRNLAIWTLGPLHKACVDYFYIEYDQLPNRLTLTAPRDAFDRSCARYGDRHSRYIPADARMILVTSPTTRKGTAKVTVNGVKINYLWYNAQLLYPHVGRSLRVRYDPFNIGAAWVWLNGRWERVVSRYERILHGLSERQLAFATQEYRKRHGLVAMQRLSDTRIVRFLKELETVEEFLTERKRHFELQRLLSIANPADLAAQASTASAEDHLSPTSAIQLNAVDKFDDDLDMDVDDLEIEELATY